MQRQLIEDLRKVLIAVIMKEEDCGKLQRCLNLLDEEAAMDRLVARLDKRPW